MKNASPQIARAVTPTVAATAQRRRAIAAATIGTALESADLTIYAFMAVALSKVFFPVGDAALALLVTFAAYGGTFIVRPLGAVVLGAYADTAGRRRALALILALMGVGSLTIALIPGYATIGVWAPVAVIAARLLQGFSAGGEQGSAVAFVSEQAGGGPVENMSWLIVAGGLGQVLGSSLGAGLAAVMTPAQIVAWGWRIPFLLGALIYPVGAYIRRFTVETLEPGPLERTHPVAATFKRHGGAVAALVFLTATGSIALYLGMYLPTYAVTKLGLNQTSSLLTTTISGLVIIGAAPLFGKLTDRVGTSPIVIPAAAMMACLAWPAFAWVADKPSFGKLLAAQILFALLFSAYTPGQTALAARMFPATSRASGASIGIALALALFGGFAPFVFSFLAYAVPDPAAPSLYLIASAGVSLIILLVLRKRRVLDA